LTSEEFLEIFKGVPQAHLPLEDLKDGLSIVDVLATKTGFLSSNGEARRALKANSISVNKEKVTESFLINETHMINKKYLLLGKGKKSNFIVVID
jgi:tyrosyl-tRNA synthetase